MLPAYDQSSDIEKQTRPDGDMAGRVVLDRARGRTGQAPIPAGEIGSRRPGRRARCPSGRNARPDGSRDSREIRTRGRYSWTRQPRRPQCRYRRRRPNANESVRCRWWQREVPASASAVRVAVVIFDLVMAVSIRLKLGSLEWPRYPWSRGRGKGSDRLPRADRTDRPGKEKVEKMSRIPAFLRFLP
jgi:hypothetical protein